ncbi:MAG: carboxypeptidase-like regulatory domain-containing protein [Acidobacteriota bacterium]
MDQRLTCRTGVRPLVAALLLLAFGAAEATASWPWSRQPDQLEISGEVVDAEGRPVEGATVLFEMRRRAFSLRSFATEEGPPLRLPAVTDTAGRYRFEVQPDGHHNLYRLVVGAPTQRGDTEDFEALLVRDLDPDQVAGGGPLRVRLTLRDAGFLRWLDRWRQDLASADESKLFNDFGKPDRLVEADDGTATWWYFDRGKVYRLRNGRLEQVDNFDPVSAAE